MKRHAILVLSAISLGTALGAPPAPATAAREEARPPAEVLRTFAADTAYDPAGATLFYEIVRE